MPGPIVFISHSRVRDGRLGDLREFLASGGPRLEADKPKTLAFLPYLSDDGTELAIVHLFADAASFTLHLEGIAERSAAADAFIETLGFDIYGDSAPESSVRWDGRPPRLACPVKSRSFSPATSARSQANQTRLEFVSGVTGSRLKRPGSSP
jgi:hypothetical protein